MDNGRESKFEMYYEKYYLQVCGYIMKKIGNVQDSEDLAMDSFVSCYRNFAKFDDTKASFATWLYVIVNNKIKNYYRDHKNNDELDDNVTISESIEESIVEAQYLSEMRDVLAKALNNLNEVQRSIVIQKYYNGFNSQKIAENLGITAVNVRVNLNRALEKIRNYFDKNVERES